MEGPSFGVDPVVFSEMFGFCKRSFTVVAWEGYGFFLMIDSDVFDQFSHPGKSALAIVAGVGFFATLVA